MMALQRPRATRAGLGAYGLLVLGLVAARGAAAGGPDLAAPLDRLIAVAEGNLQAGELQSAESHYRSVLGDGWMLMGLLRAAEGDPAAARDAFGRASVSVADARGALQYLAMAHIELGEAAEAASILTQLASRNAQDAVIRRLLAQAMILSGRTDEAVQELEEVQGLVPQDLEVSYALATAYLRVQKPEFAEPLFAELAKARPIPATWVLIGRTYRDYKEYDRARAALRKALELDPNVRRAHYHLGMIDVLSEGANALDPAIAEFEQELRLAPDDPGSNLYIGLALVVARRYEEALPALEKAVRALPRDSRAHHYLGRCQLALGRPAEAVSSLERALELAAAPGVDEAKLRNMHYQLGLALRRLGREDDAAPHFAAAEEHADRLQDTERDQLDRYLRSAPDPEGQPTPAVPVIDMSPVLALSEAERSALESRLRTMLARAYFNLGVMQAQAKRFARAAEHLAHAAEVDPEFPQVQYSLGVALYNAQRFDEATGPLARALEAAPDATNLRRMLAMAWLNTEAYDKAADLLADDPGRRGDPSLQYAYGLSLVRSERAAEALRVFSTLLSEHGDSAELNVLLGQAYAQQSDFTRAIDFLQRALELKADVAGAGSSLGVIYLRQGKLPEAERALRAELSHHPGDHLAQHTLAAVLEMQGQLDEALTLLRSVLQAEPDFADARYLFGKILLAQGSAHEALEQLQAAVRIAPEDANVHYQLGRAYQRIGRGDAAEEQFEIFQRLKAKSREPAS